MTEQYEKKPIGRPKKDWADRGVKEIRIRVSPRQDAMIQELARERMTTVSELIRACVLAAAVAARNPGVAKALGTGLPVVREVVEPDSLADVEGNPVSG